jgi:adenosylmethionine-8-amino-7-oxononanoate aminotransferase
VSHVFPRVFDRQLPTAVSADGEWITDADGKRYLDGAGGAIVVSLGHGDADLIRAATDQLARTQYVHGTSFTTEAVEAYAEEVSEVLPVDDARIYPVSGGSEAVETAIKMARAYHLARKEPSRTTLISRRSSYHGNTIGALDASGKEPLRKPYTPWLGRFLHAPAAYEYRCENPSHPELCGPWHAAELERMVSSYGPESIMAFLAEPVSGATLGAAVPSDDYWPAIVEVCRRHGILVIADEVMTGFGRTGRWFGGDHWDLRPDILTAGKGSTSGYVPFGFAAASGEVFETIARGGFTPGFTWSHNARCSGACATTIWSPAHETSASACASASARSSTRCRSWATFGAWA